MNNKILSVLILILTTIQIGYAQNHAMTLENASFQFKDSTIIVSTGKVERKWSWTGNGLITTSYKNLISDKEWATTSPDHTADWDLPTKTDADSKAELLSIHCVETNDEKFTSNHLLITTHMRYDFGLEVKHLIRVYPNSSGIWTALEVKSLDSFSSEGIPEDLGTTKYYGSTQPVKIARSEYVPVDFSQPNQRRYWGIYNDPGNRVNTKDMVKEEVKQGYPLFRDEHNSWANGLSIESQGEGLMLIKESNKTVNKYGHQTGSIYCTPQGVEVTGWGLKPQEITSEFRQTWPTWSILFSGDEDQMELALKQFDRVRYPVNLERDMHILTDTWGSDFQNGEYNTYYGRVNSEFSVIEKEIKSASELGIDIVRIDDGWQEGGTLSKDSWHPNTEIGYSEHWKKTKLLSSMYGVRIGLWAAVRFISGEELLTNQKELGVATWKFDFDKLEDWQAFDARMKGIREFIKTTNYSTQVSWCPEYDDQRYGWYNRNREYGPMYFQNIQNNFPNHIVYVPYISLRGHWTMSRFYNMNDLQLHWQNPSRTNPKLSDAYLHSQSYAAMSAFVGAPSCFMLTQLLKSEERVELKKTIGTYKEHRKEIYESFVFPIGDEPNNASWAGFQMYHPEKKAGYLMVFRELHNAQKTQELDLKFIKNKKIRLTDVERGELISETLIENEGKITLSIPNPASYRFIRYEILSD